MVQKEYPTQGNQEVIYGISIQYTESEKPPCGGFSF
jgi:hypothetical protein